MRHTAKQTAKAWRSGRPPIPGTGGGLAVWSLKYIYRAKKYSANPWRSDWRSDPQFGGLTGQTARPPSKSRSGGLIPSTTDAGVAR